MIGGVCVQFPHALTCKWSEMRVGGWQVCTLPAGMRSVAFSPDGKRVVTGSLANLVQIWNAETGVEVSSIVWECFAHGVVMEFFLLRAFDAGFSLNVF